MLVSVQRVPCTAQAMSEKGWLLRRKFKKKKVGPTFKIKCGINKRGSEIFNKTVTILFSIAKVV